jgi:hypothetical protein
VAAGVILFSRDGCGCIGRTYELSQILNSARLGPSIVHQRHRLLRVERAEPAAHVLGPGRHAVHRHAELDGGPDDLTGTACFIRSLYGTQFIAIRC